MILDKSTHSTVVVVVVVVMVVVMVVVVVVGSGVNSEEDGREHEMNGLGSKLAGRIVVFFSFSSLFLLLSSYYKLLAKCPAILCNMNYRI